VLDEELLSREYGRGNHDAHTLRAIVLWVYGHAPGCQGDEKAVRLLVGVEGELVEERAQPGVGGGLGTFLAGVGIPFTFELLRTIQYIVRFSPPYARPVLSQFSDLLFLDAHPTVGKREVVLVNHDVSLGVYAPTKPIHGLDLEVLPNAHPVHDGWRGGPEVLTILEGVNVSSRAHHVVGSQDQRGQADLFSHPLRKTNWGRHDARW
ncbi:hypothetical protein B484DRAFT_460849, partial [Ochromonadaceae sp. CCMP2298]